MTHSIKGKQNKQRKRKSIKKIPMYFLPFISFGFFFLLFFHSFSHPLLQKYVRTFYLCRYLYSVPNNKKEFGVFFCNVHRKKNNKNYLLKLDSC